MSYKTAKRFRSSGVTHSKDHALSDIEFERLVEKSYELKKYHDLESRLILFACGRLGMRLGELTHMEADWIDWRKERINIPLHQPCTRGTDGGRCGQCRQNAKQMADYNDDITFEEALGMMWSPKTEAAARSIPFGFSARCRIIIERYFTKFDRWMYSSSVVGRRIDWLVEKTDEVDQCHPHALRSTAATHHAGRGVDMLALQSFMGWADLQTAKKYIAGSAENVDHKLRLAHK